ncbi:helix-turn-helix transcriptional regulator [Jeotgalibacillus sp. ET6]|uniref:helix-turn-helix domain-containing protein n=1 Tax=Jeotgalibacillus sp. ET6 TaxID=3037260 RepID=UPI0024187216|nr:helix-turn-helix transcriptional regulator [Jeotgalibacillus sp. ET6]MDG5473697.1 helix-turn-helix transcriptional regulator [Jeotgalibacillus sp. ET6]
MTDREGKSWGRLIKYHRQQQSLRQDDVALGICTPSYLSRIENGVVVAEQTVYEMLLARLGIDFENEVANLELKHSLLEIMYAKLLSNETLTQSELAALNSYQSEVLHQEIDLLAGLVYSRYLSSIDELIEARKLLMKIEPFITWHQDRVTQMYIAITTNVHLLFLEFEEIIFREEQQHVSNYMNTANRFEQANYLYHLAFAHHRYYSFQQALYYINRSADTFSHQYKPLFQLKLYSMKGVILNDLHRFQEALLEFEAGLELLRNVSAIQTPRQWSSLYNNLAYCYECQGLFKEAMSYYEQANSSEEDLHVVINWMRAAYQQGDEETLLKLFTNYPRKRFEVLHHQYQRELLNYASERDYTLNKLNNIEELVFPYFSEQEHYSLTLYYAPLWAAFYEELHAYKRASICFKHAFIASEKVRRRMGS